MPRQRTWSGYYVYSCNSCFTVKVLNVCPRSLLVSRKDVQQQVFTPHTRQQAKAGVAKGYGRALQDAPPALANELAVKLGGKGCQGKTRRQNMIREFSETGFHPNLVLVWHSLRNTW